MLMLHPHAVQAIVLRPGCMSAIAQWGWLTAVRVKPSPAGFGMRIMEAVAYGCIPVIVQVRAAMLWTGLAGRLPVG